MNMLNNDIILEIQSNPKIFSQSKTINNLEKIILKLNNLYYNNESPITDYQYDILYDELKNKYNISKLDFKKSPCYNVGFDVNSPTKHKLPYYCGSLDKVKPNSNDLRIFKEKYKDNYILSEKIDGIPLLIEYDCKKFKIYTRGNGKYGLMINQNILKIIDFPIENIINKFTYFCIKGECVLNKDSKYNTNLRNIVNGLLHKKELDMNIKLNYIAYEILSPRMNILNQFKLLKSLNFKIPNFINVNNLDNLEKIYLLFRNKSTYNIDGLVITHNDNYPVPINKNPNYSKAFKMVLEDQIKETRIKEIVWNISKNGLLKPTILLDTIEIDKTKISKTTGFNAKYIIDNQLGKDSIVKIIKSGDVIPYVHSIIKSTKPNLPNCNYKWNNNKIDFMIIDLNNNEYKKSLLLHFVNNMEIKYINDGIIDILYNNGYDNIYKLININKNDLLQLPKFNEILSNKIYNSINDKMKNPDLINLLVASNVFGNGIGKKKVYSILNNIPNIFSLDIDDDLNNKLLNIDGINTITSDKIIKGIISFKKFINDYNIKNIKFNNNKISDKLLNKNFVFSGFRDKELENTINSNGGKVISNISNNTNYLVIDKDSNSKKVEFARINNIKIISKNNLNTLIYG